MMLDLGPGDTVVVPSFTFATTALAFARQGARLLFCDIEPRTLGLDPAHLATLLDDTRAGGRAGPLRRASRATSTGIRQVLADRPDVALIEDNAHGLLGRWHGQPLGSLGRFSALSFHETKNFICGEGGALLLNDARDVDRARVLYDKGTNRRAFLLGQVDKYSWKDIGSSFGLSDVLAAYLLAQLEQRDDDPGQAAGVHERYTRLLAPHAGPDTFTLPERAGGLRARRTTCSTCCSPTVSAATRSWRRCATAGVQPTFHYVPLHSSDAGRSFAARHDRVPGDRRHQRPAAAAAVLQRPRRRRRRRARGRDVPRLGDRHRRRSERGRSSHTAWLLLAAPARLLVVPRPRRAAAHGPGPVPRRVRPRSSTWAAPTARASAGCRAATAGSRSTCSPAGSRPVRASAGPPSALPFADRASTWSPPSTWSSTASARRWRWPSSTRVLRPGRPDAAVGAGLPVGLVRPRRPGRPPPPLHQASARRRSPSARGSWSTGRRTRSAAVFPFFVAERLLRRIKGPAGDGDGRLTSVPDPVQRLLLRLSAAEQRVLRRRDVPFGSSVFLAATKPGA